MEGIIEANQERNKVPHLKRISVELDKLRILIRLSKDLKFINVKQYGFAAGKINEIGKMLGGWLKSSRTHRDRELYYNTGSKCRNNSK